MRWKNFKNKLTIDFVGKGLIENPSEEYDLINQEVWENFVRQHSTLEFQVY